MPLKGKGQYCSYLKNMAHSKRPGTKARIRGTGRASIGWSEPLVGCRAGVIGSNGLSYHSRTTNENTRKAATVLDVGDVYSLDTLTFIL